MKNAVKLLLCLLTILPVSACRDGSDKFVGSWQSDTYRTTVDIAKASEENYIVYRKNPRYAVWDKQATGFYNKDTKSIAFKVSEEDFPNPGYVDKTYNIIYVEEEDKIFVDDDGNLGEMSKVVK